ncbi:MAG: redox-regulated ATPase YchF [SAR86 cluster bacterium]|jgi:GTP-binding protein YchF|nr:redox-regulated ATPase YchF [SAR86 cluster bacterium]HIC26864.1 redox-regulated ATPase YchF [Gammaproteobacteria bacterium]
MSLKCGIVGLPNVGKSTLFNALTSAGIEAQNFPFCTIEPNLGIVPVPDERLELISKIVNSKSIIPATTEFIDIAGLVKGASLGEGLGNQFLSHIRETQAIIHVIRCFKNDNIAHVHEQIDPVADLEVVETELLLADLETVLKAKIKLERLSKSGDKDAEAQQSRLETLEEEMNRGILCRNSSFALENDTYFKDLQLITMKPCLYLANVAEKDQNNDLLKKLVDYAGNEGDKVLPLCNQIEAEIAELDKEDGKEILKDLGIDEPGLNKLIRESFRMLNLQTFFTTDSRKVRAWTIRKGLTALQAAGEIHTDFEKGFIKAEIVSYEDFIKHNGENGAIAAGKLRTEGANYMVEDGDVIHFLFNV